MQCKWCGKSLVTIGNDRKNGKHHDDWKDRKLHKKCWKTLNDAYFLHINDHSISKLIVYHVQFILVADVSYKNLSKDLHNVIDHVQFFTNCNQTFLPYCDYNKDTS